jgi:hypothetical protein
MKLVAGSALFISAKYEEIYPPILKDFSQKMKINKIEILKMEEQIIQAISF